MIAQEMNNAAAESEDENARNKLCEAGADVARCWIKYCVAFLEHCAKKLVFRQVAEELERSAESTVLVILIQRFISKENCHFYSYKEEHVAHWDF